MSWAKHAIKELKEGREVTIKPRGYSMEPRIKNGQIVTVMPCEPRDIKSDDVVLVTVRGRDFLHLVKAVDGKRFLIGNMKGHVNGWVGHNKIHGKMK
jgi:phage repressor protein C with HTH and peptisase S24 domain